MTGGLELGDVYGATIERIKGQDGDKSRIGMAALMWISHAERPLRADELCHALAVKLGSTDFDTGNIPSVPTLVNCCQGLITVDKEASTVRLIHFTLQEYLSATNIFSNPHSAMGKICLTYLNSQSVKAFSADPSPNTRNAPFLEYCLVYWGVHGKRELSDCGRSLALELLKGDYSQISTRLPFAQAKHFYFPEFPTFSPFSGLHCASFFGIVEVVASLIELNCSDINEGDFSGCGPLTRAAQNGHEAVVEILLGQGEVNPDKPDNGGQTPLWFAAKNGHGRVVKILLEREEVNPDKLGEFGQTPLSLAARNGYEWVVKILLGREEVNPDKPNWMSLTPLSFAAQYGNKGVVKILLGREEVDPDKPDNDGRTPLSWAAQNGHEGVVKILLGREEVDPNKLDVFGQTPLSCAVRMGHEGVAKILLGREQAYLDKPDRWGQTPLSYAAESGHEGIVKILLGREEVNPNTPDEHGQTPLSHAAQNGHEGVVKILLGREEVNPDMPDNMAQTPLSFAAQIGHQEVVKILLEREEVNPDKPDEFGQTPLSLATRNGHERVVALLQSCKVISPPHGLSPSRPRLVEITPDPSLSRHATRRDALGHRPLLTGGIHEIGMQLYVIPFCVFFVIFLCGWAISEFLFPKSF